MCPFAVGTFCALFVSGLEMRAILVKVVCGTPDACTHTLTFGVIVLWVPLLAIALWVPLLAILLWVPLLTIKTLGNWPIITTGTTSVPIVMGWDAFFVCVTQQ